MNVKRAAVQSLGYKMRDIRNWFGLRSPTQGQHNTALPDNERLSEDDAILKQSIDKALGDKFINKDLVVREVQYEAFDRLLKIIKIYTALIGIPVGLIIGFFAFEGIKDAKSFFASIEPRIKAAQSSIDETQKKLNIQRVELADNEGTIRSMRTRLIDQGRSVTDFQERVAALQPQVTTLQNQLKSLTSQTDVIVNQNKEDHLEQDFLTFGKGDLAIQLDNQPYKAPENPNGRPIVYLTSSASIVSGHDITDIHHFEDGIAKLGYKFVYGSFTIQKGKTAAAGNMVPAPGCTQVVYYDVKYLAAANDIAHLVTDSFHIQTPIAFLISPDKSSAIDPISRTIIEASKVNISASVNIPDPIFCQQYLKSLQ